MTTTGSVCISGSNLIALGTIVNSTDTLPDKFPGIRLGDNLKLWQYIFDGLVMPAILLIHAM